jgi:two-component system sensor histidine kinase KdpD
LVSNLLDMTRIQAGVFEVRPLPTSLVDLVAGVVDALRPSLEGQVVEVRLAPNIPPVDVDRLLVEQVLANLLDNAHRHSPPQCPIVVAADRSGPGRIAVSVTDAGAGVARDERVAVFESFARFDTGGRAGLGLAIAKAFIEAHGQRIWVEEPPGGGGRFVFTLPTVMGQG